MKPTNEHHLTSLDPLSEKQLENRHSLTLFTKDLIKKSNALFVLKFI